MTEYNNDVGLFYEKIKNLVIAKFFEYLVTYLNAQTLSKFLSEYPKKAGIRFAASNLNGFCRLLADDTLNNWTVAKLKDLKEEDIKNVISDIVKITVR